MSEGSEDSPEEKTTSDASVAWGGGQATLGGIFFSPEHLHNRTLTYPEGR